MKRSGDPFFFLKVYMMREPNRKKPLENSLKTRDFASIFAPMELDPLLVHAEVGELELLKGEIEKVRDWWWKWRICWLEFLFKGFI